MSLGKQRVQRVEYVVDIFSDEPARAVAAVSSVPDQGSFYHGHAEATVDREDCHVRMGNDTEELLPDPLRLKFGLDALMHVGASSCRESQVSL